MSILSHNDMKDNADNSLSFIKSVQNILDNCQSDIHGIGLFDQPQTDQCPICLLTMPPENNGVVAKTCCGKRICAGCNMKQVLYDFSKCHSWGKPYQFLVG